ncbi:MAG: response regulator [Verrucomicrobia bacterium]|nr:response regulator [Verrucomicrobiota bacterium]
MSLRNVSRDRWLRWALTLACAGLGVAANLSSAGLTHRATFLLLYPAVIIGGYLGGLGPATAAALVGALSIPFVNATWFRSDDWSALGSVLFFLVNCSLIVALSDALHRARRGVEPSVGSSPPPGSGGYSKVLIWSASLGSLALAIALNPEVAFVSQGRLPYVIFIPVMALASYLGGLRPALVVTVIGVSSVWVWHRHVGGIAGAPFYGLTGAYVFVGTVLGWLGQALVRERQRSAAGARALLDLPEAQARFENAARLLPDTLWIWDLGQERFVFVSPACEALLGYRANEILGQSVERLRERLHPDDVAATLASLDALALKEPGKTVDFECRIRPREGDWRWVRSRVGTFDPTANGAPARLFGHSEDVSERRAIADQLARQARELQKALQERLSILDAERAARDSAEKANRLKDDFLAIASHELRTPLTAISGWAAILSEDASPSTVAQAVEVIARNVRAQGHLIDDLLDMSRLMRGDFRIEPKPVATHVAAKTAREAAEPIARRQQVELMVDPGPVGCFALADPQRLQQMLGNLLGNAIKFTPAGGRVALECGPQDDSVVFRITDTGQGIAPEFLPQVFDRFSQQDSRTSRRSGGLGLGLAIVKHLAALHGGKVEARSAGLGQGSVFSLTLPRWQEQSGAALAEGGPGSDHNAEVPLDHLRLVVIDDDKDTCEFAARVLSRRGARVSLAHSAAAGLALIEQDSPDAVICDISMPDEDGFHFIRTLRQTAWPSAQVPCLALTALARAEDRERVLAAGFNAHCPKPVEPGALARAVVRMLRPSQSEAQRRAI